MTDYLKIEELIIGETYKVDGRNFSVAVWDGKGFIGDRHKFGKVFSSLELHYDSDLRYGTVKPLRRLGHEDNIKV